MIIKLLPEQIAHRWETIKWAIGQAFLSNIELSAEHMNKVLENLLNDAMQCWIGVEDKRIVGIAITNVVVDDCTGIKSLLYFALIGFGMSDEVYAEGLRAFRLFGKSKECESITAYTDSEELVEKAKQLGGSVRYFITFPIGEIE